MRSPFTNRIMKKILFILSAILLFAACSDSKEETPATQSGSTIVGTWRYTKYEAGYSLEITMIFNADGTYTENGVETAPHGSFPWSGSGRYTYNETAQLLTMIDSEENEPIYTKAVVSGNTLTIWNEDGDYSMIYTRTK